MTGDGAEALGARNLLINCAGLEKGQRLLVVHEDPDLGWYDLDAPLAVAAEAEKLRVPATLLAVGGPGNSPDPRVEEAIAGHDVIVFFARIGDQDRFAEPPPGKTIVMSYAQTRAMLASAFGTTDNRAFVALKDAVNSILLAAGDIDIRCPLGTALSGRVSESARASPLDVSVRRFPVGVPQPIEAAGFFGRIALARYLTPTGSRVYDPAFLAIDQPVFAEVASGRIASFSGDAATVARVRAHHDRVAKLFRIDGDVVHSWHAGIHPGCAYPARAADNPDRWSNTAFANPRFLHFHCCGAYAPGEICWMVLDPTVLVDGQALWERGRLRVADFPATRDCLDDWPELELLFADPSDQIGLAE